jgi:polysaccharide biosynthesis transport protein
MDVPTSGSEFSPSSDRSALLAGIRVLRERWWLVLLCTLLCIGIAAALSLSSTKQYTAKATLLVRPSNLSALINPAQTQTIDPAREAADALSILQSGAVASRVKHSLHLPESASDLQGRVDATADPNTDIISVAITDPDSQKAALLANGFADALVGYLTQADQGQIAAGQAQISQELAQLSKTGTASSARNVLEQALKQVVALRAVTNGDVQIVDHAQRPTSPSSPNLKRNIAISGVLGLILGVALAFVIDLFDRRIKTSEDLERLYGLAALTSVPLRRRRPTNERETQLELEPFRILRDVLHYVSTSETDRVVLVTSAVQAEGKTRVATGLARAIAAASRTVVVVEVDVRRAAVSRQFRLQPQSPGLVTALAEGGVTTRDLVQPVPEYPGLYVLPSGPFTPTSAELLRLPAMTKVLADLASQFEYVILDCPPLLPVADAQALLDNAMIDVVLVVARPDLTTRDQIRNARTVLRRHPGITVGLIINAVRATVTGYYTGPSRDGAPGTRRGLGHLMARR